jgi:hypothetical protein
MTEELSLQSVADGTLLRWQGRIDNDEFFTTAVTLKGKAVEASDQVYDRYAPGWTELFESLAQDWRGWEGERALESLEGQLRVSCTSDRLGHVRLRVTMRGDLGRSDWMAESTIYLEAGQLADLAQRARAYFGPPRRAFSKDG